MHSLPTPASTSTQVPTCQLVFYPDSSAQHSGDEVRTFPDLDRSEPHQEAGLFPVFQTPLATRFFHNMSHPGFL